MSQRAVGLLAASLLIGLGAVRGASASDVAQQAAPETAKPVLVLEGPTAMITVLIKPDKTADFELVLDKLREALLKSENPVRQKQAAGWFVYKGGQPIQGNTAYIMRIEPVVPGEEYDISRLIAEVFPTEVQEIFEKYRGAFAGRAIAGLSPLPPMQGQ